MIPRDPGLYRDVQRMLLWGQCGLVTVFLVGAGLVRWLIL